MAVKPFSIKKTTYGHFMNMKIVFMWIIANYIQNLISYTGVKPRYSILRKQGYLILIVEKHLAFYKVNEKKHLVTIYSVMDNRREYQNLI